ncbi:MAG: hypothetical protein LBV15_01810 [Planctomycetota bacterium]|jgi:hypothetical protein|nr:hypothetical protein [Planctomycetota bacterium]
MMVKKMAGFFSILGVLVFLGNWLYFRMLPDQGGARPMDAEKAWEISIYLAAGFFMLGLFVSTLGIALVQEALAESRSRDTEKKFKAKASYDQAMAVAMAAPAQPKAAGGEEG